MVFASVAEMVASLPERAALMGLDLGEKTMGLAISDPTRLIASPLAVLPRSRFTKDAKALVARMVESAAAGLVIGLPVNMDGREGPRCQSTRAFARNLQGLAPTPVAFWDERLSTAAVSRMLEGEADLSRRRRAQLVDKAAAAWILQGALDSLRRSGGGPREKL